MTKEQLFKTAIVNTHDSIFDKGTVVAVQFAYRIEGYANVFLCSRDNQSQPLVDFDLKGFVL